MLADIVVARVRGPRSDLAQLSAAVLLLGALLALARQAAALGEQREAGAVGALLWHVQILVSALVVATTVVRIGKDARLLAVELATYRHLALGLPSAAKVVLVAAVKAALRLAFGHLQRLPLSVHERAVAQCEAVHTDEAGQAHGLTGIGYQLSRVNAQAEVHQRLAMILRIVLARY